MADGKIVRWEIEPLKRSRRGLDEHVAIATPWLTRLVSAAVERMPAGSHVRRAMLTWGVRTGFAANNRGDYEAMQATFHPEVEIIPPGRGREGLGFDPVYRGREDVRRFFEQWKSGFGGFTYRPREIADAGGPCFAVRTELVARIGGTDDEVREEWATVYRVRDGLVIRMENFYDWSAALAALAET